MSINRSGSGSDELRHPRRQATAGGGGRTRTELTLQGILSPLCLPFHHAGILLDVAFDWAGIDGPFNGPVLRSRGEPGQNREKRAEVERAKPRPSSVEGILRAGILWRQGTLEIAPNGRGARVPRRKNSERFPKVRNAMRGFSGALFLSIRRFGGRPGQHQPSGEKLPLRPLQPLRENFELSVSGGLRHGAP